MGPEEKSSVCVAFRCENCVDDETNNERGITFHKFPESESVRSVWIRNCRWLNWTPSESSVLCSKHFAPECFDADRKLKANAAPTVFDYPPELQLVTKLAKSSRKNTSDHSYSFPDASAELGAKLRSFSERCSRMDERNKALVAEIKSLKRKNERLVKQVENNLEMAAGPPPTLLTPMSATTSVLNTSVMSAPLVTSTPMLSEATTPKNLDLIENNSVIDHSRVTEGASMTPNCAFLTPLNMTNTVSGLSMPESEMNRSAKRRNEARSKTREEAVLKVRSTQTRLKDFRAIVRNEALQASDDECQIIDQEWLERRKRLCRKRPFQPRNTTDKQDVVDEQSKAMFFVLSEDGTSATTATQEQFKELMQTEGMQTKVEDLVIHIQQ